MKRYERQAKILKLVSQRGFVENEELSRLFSVTQGTIRRDIKTLAGQNQIRVEHGGTASLDLLNNFIEPRYETKYHLNIQQKKAIAAEAVSRIDNDQTIILDSGTTNFQIARLLCERRLLKLTVITCDIQIARLLCSQETFTVILLGGMLRKNYCYSYGFIASNILDNLIADKFFLGIDAISLIAGITCATLDEIPLKRASMKASSEVVAVVDSSKFGICTPYRLCDWEDIQCILTDDRAELSYLEFFKQQGCKVIASSA